MIKESLMKDEVKNAEAFEKSIDTLIDELFAEGGEELEKGAKSETMAIAEKSPAKGKSIGDDQKPVMTADENGAAKEGEEDEEAGKKRGRPADLSTMSERDANGASKGKYDASITEKAKTPPNETTVAKSFTVTEEEYELLQKAKADQKEETLRKAVREQKDLIKSAVIEATKPLADENEALRKSLNETQELVKSMARKPQPRKSVSSVQVLEKSFQDGAEGGNKAETFTKSEMLDTAEELVKSNQLNIDHVVELENTGYIFEPRARAVLEKALKNRK